MKTKKLIALIGYICSKCKLDKEPSCFYLDKNSNISRSQCKDCICKINTEYRNSHKEKNKEKSKNLSKEKKDKIKEYQKKYKKNYRINKKNELKNYQKQYYINNKYIELENQKNRRLLNRESLNALSRENYKYNKEEICKNKQSNYNYDPCFKLKQIISSTIRTTLKQNNSSKNGESCLKYLPYTIKELKNYIEAQFINENSWMNWNNWKTYSYIFWDDNDKSTWTWNLDHILPKSKLKYFSMTDYNFFICWQLSNLRPYSAKQNILDGNKR